MIAMVAWYLKKMLKRDKTMEKETRTTYKIPLKDIKEKFGIKGHISDIGMDGQKTNLIIDMVVNEE